MLGQAAGACPDSALGQEHLVEFARMHIENDVHWFVRALINYQDHFSDTTLPRNTIVAYLDSALLHGRSLLEFFSHKPGRKKDIRSCHYRKNRCGTPGFKGPSISGFDPSLWTNAINHALAHLTTERGANLPRPVDIIKRGGKELERWRLEDLDAYLQARFQALSQDCTTAESRQFFEELVGDSWPLWSSQR